ncbi:hypothetical protein DQG23_17475 [Paenibacillus contaminans]|uniref:Uncharacterized protein n=1 Tax=Paenibacillus contaminans TaxID=450362 RepID=A0A329MKU8_9BACL|nr:hypothetical protein DQG23_17475 [Paenibacillus contaminans]
MVLPAYYRSAVVPANLYEKSHTIARSAVVPTNLYEKSHTKIIPRQLRRICMKNRIQLLVLR